MGRGGSQAGAGGGGVGGAAAAWASDLGLRGGGRRKHEKIWKTLSTPRERRALSTGGRKLSGTIVAAVWE